MRSRSIDHEQESQSNKGKGITTTADAVRAAQDLVEAFSYSIEALLGFLATVATT